MALERLHFARRGEVHAGLVELLEARTGEAHGLDTDAWYHGL